MHFYRIPKTGSTALLKTVLPELRCESVTVHDHRTGCPDLSWCNGSLEIGILPTQSIFATIRHVCSRLESQWQHMVRADRAQFGHCKTPEQFLALLQNWTAGCPGKRAGVDCKVRAINRVYRRSHRVILWPQAFYMSPRTMPICYHPQFLEERIQNQVEAITSCKAPPQENIEAYMNVREYNSSMTLRVCAGAARLYDEDDQIWHMHCKDELAAL